MPAHPSINSILLLKPLPNFVLPRSKKLIERSIEMIMQGVAGWLPYLAQALK